MAERAGLPPGNLEPRGWAGRGELCTFSGPALASCPAPVVHSISSHLPDHSGLKAGDLSLGHPLPSISVTHM